jgi:enoyl-CoA hydratase/carnithine racemase
MSDRVLISITDGVADVVFNRADKRNALDNAMFTAIAEAGEQLKSEPGLRAVVLSGDGASFCAGLDFSSFQAMAGDDAASAATRSDGNPGQMKDGRITHLGQQVCWVWQELEVPVIAAVHGHALGGGLQIALGADIRIAHPDTKMSVREVYWGLVPDMTGTFILSKLVRPDIAKELTFTARIFSGTEAAEMGLVTRLSDTPKDDAMAMAREIAGHEPRSGPWRQIALQPTCQRRSRRAVRRGTSVDRRPDRYPEPGRGGHGGLREAPSRLRRRLIPAPASDLCATGAALRHCSRTDRPADRVRTPRTRGGE